MAFGIHYILASSCQRRQIYRVQLCIVLITWCNCCSIILRRNRPIISIPKIIYSALFRESLPSPRFYVSVGKCDLSYTFYSFYLKMFFKPL